MAKVVSMGYVDTPVEGVTGTTLNFNRQVLNFKSDFRIKAETVGKEVILTNITSPTDRPEKIRIGYQDVNNIYNGSGIDASVAAPTKRGVSILAQLTQIKTVTDDTDPDYRIDLPMSFQLVVKVPASQHITAEDVEYGVGRLLSSLYDSGKIDLTRLNAILRGSLVPSEL